MKGSLKDIQKGIKELCKRLEEFYKSINKEFSRYAFNVVIPANYVTKIIGAGGCMVKNIAQHANGAQIKINATKDLKQNIREVSVAINGTLEGKYRAAHLIIEQVEIFKNGGPVSAFSLFPNTFFPDNLKRQGPQSKLSSTNLELWLVER